MENGDLIKNKLTGTIGIIIDDKAIKNGQRRRMKIYYNAEEISACHLVGKKLFSYAGKICFYEYSYPEEVELYKDGQEN